MTLFELSNVTTAAAAISHQLRITDIEPDSREVWHVNRMISSLRSFSCGLFPEKRILADRWPNFTCLVLCWRYDESTDEVEVFCRNQPQAVAATCAALIAWFRCSPPGKLRVLSLPDYLQAQLEAYCAGMGAVPIAQCKNYMLTRSSLEAPKLSASLTSRPLGSEEIPVLMKNWKFANPNMLKWMAEIVRDPKRSLGVFDGSTMVGHVVIHRYGTIGALFVDPGFRKRGIGKFLVERLCQVFWENESYPVLEVEVENTGGEQFFRNLNFSCVSRTSYLTLEKET